MQLATIDRPHKVRLAKEAPPEKRLMPVERRETAERTVDAGYRLAMAEPWADLDLTTPQRAAAEEIARLWHEAALHQRSTTMDFDRLGGGTGEMSDRRAHDHARLSRALRAMGAWRSVEVVALICYGERHRDREIVTDGLDIAARVWGL